MFYSIEDRQRLENLTELVLLQNQVKASRLQDNLGKQNFHQDIKNLFNRRLIYLKMSLKI